MMANTKMNVLCTRLVYKSMGKKRDTQGILQKGFYNHKISFV